MSYLRRALSPTGLRRPSMATSVQAVMPMMHLDTGKGLVVLDLPGAVILETNSLDGNEGGYVLRSPVHVHSIHAGLISRVEVRDLSGTSSDIRTACKRRSSLYPRLGAGRT